MRMLKENLNKDVMSLNALKVISSMILTVFYKQSIYLQITVY